MKGVILAGGLGSRLYPLTKATNKHLLPVGKEPMLYHPIKQLVSAGIQQVLVVTSTAHMGDIVRCLGSGREFGCMLQYKVQEQASGIADALSLAEEFVAGDKVCVLLGDNVFEYSIAPYVREFEQQGEGARVLLKKVDEPSRFGVAALDEHQILSIEEKPDRPKSEYAVVGLYFFDHRVFDFIRRTEPSERGELEITTVNNLYIGNDLLKYSVCQGRWSDAGTFESLYEACEILNAQDNKILEIP